MSNGVAFGDGGKSSLGTLDVALLVEVGCRQPAMQVHGVVGRIEERWAEEDDPRPPVFILVATNKRIAEALFEWIGEGRNPAGVASLNVPDLTNSDGRIVTFRIDTGVVAARTHLNFVVCDTITWEQSAGYHLDNHPAVRSFVKNHGLQFAIPYLHNGKASEYLPDFVARLALEEERYLIAEVKGANWEGTAEIKAQAAVRWCAAVNATGRFGLWDYVLARHVSELVDYLDALPLPRVYL